MRLWFIFRKKRRLIFLILLVALFFSLTESYFDDNVIEYVKIKAMQIYEKNVTAVIKKSILENMDENLMKLKYNDGKISYAYLDTYEALNIKAEASSMLSKLNPEIENMVNYVSVPVGYFFTKKFMLTDGLKVPLRLTVYQAFDSDKLKWIFIFKSLFKNKLLIMRTRSYYRQVLLIMRFLIIIFILLRFRDKRIVLC